MPDSKSKKGKQDRSKVAANQDYEVEYLAKQQGVSPEEARKLIKQHGPQRAAIIAAEAKQTKRPSRY